jgi:lantibiotic transport system permease protein
MGRYLNLMRSEGLKLRKSSIWLLIFVSPALATVLGFFLLRFEEPDRQQWMYLISDMSAAHGILFLPLLAGIFAAFVCRYEHDSGGWKQLLALPVKRTTVYVVKLSVVVLLLAATQLLLLGGMIAVAKLVGIDDPMPVGLLLQSVLGGLIASLPLAALQLAVSVGWANFAAPLAINVILTLPNILIVNSATYGPYYPWAQPFLAMMPDTGDSFGALNVSFATLMIVIVGGFAVFFLSGLAYFRRREV